ncbi:MAG: hypothetical protein RR543_04040 [Erysipelotrichales bacterium]
MNKSSLKQWPVQIKLIDPQHQSFEDSTLLVAADCAAYAYADFHKDFIDGKTTIIGCPKLDDVDYAIKLTQIIENNNINKIVVVRMEVPCCTGIKDALERAVVNSGKDIEVVNHIISLGGELIA